MFFRIGNKVYSTDTEKKEANFNGFNLGHCNFIEYVLCSGSELKVGKSKKGKTRDRNIVRILSYNV